jgi:hypothetical protein
MLERPYATTNHVLEPITFILSFPTVCLYIYMRTRLYVISVITINMKVFSLKTITLVTRGGAVVEALRPNRTVWDRFQMVLMKFFIYIILPAALWPWGRISL